jgi:hypothetical protein
MICLVNLHVSHAKLAELCHGDVNKNLGLADVLRRLVVLDDFSAVNFHPATIRSLRLDYHERI